VELHREQLGGGFMTSLGPRFLGRVFRNLAGSAHGVALVATCEEGRVCGFLMGATDTGALYRDFLRRHALGAGLTVLPSLLRPSVIRKIYETLRYPSREPETDRPLPTPELLDLAVDDSRKGSGLAQALFDRFVEELRGRGSSAFRITSGASLTRAHRFYERLGAVPAGSVEVHRGEATLIYVYEIPGAAGAAAAESDDG